MRSGLRDVADQIVEDLMKLNSDEERRQVLAVIGLIFCDSCGRVSSELEVSVTSTSSTCVHGRGLPNEIVPRQRILSGQEQDATTTARLLRSRYPL